MKNLSQNLYNICSQHRICDEYKKLWNNGADRSEQELLNMIKAQPEFMSRLSLDEIGVGENGFDKNLLHENNIYISGDNITDVNPGKVYLFGTAKLTIMINSGKYKFYLFNNSTLDITVSNDAEVSVTCYGESNMNLINNETKIIPKVKKSSLNCNFTVTGNYNEIDDTTILRLINQIKS